MNIHGYELIKDWKVSNIGMTTQAKKGDTKYFLKKYGEYKMPRHDESTNARLYDKLKAEFDSFMGNRIAINKALSSLAGPGGNIILPTNWFVDDIYYIEATEFVDNLIEDEDILRLSKEEILFIMLTATGALFNIHRKNIVHSDLKRTNILAARNSSGKTVAKIIDFDRSYFANDIRPDELGGDQSFMSPELAQCFMYDMSDEALEYLSTKSDIFSLGLVFHNYLTKGGFPKISGLTGALKARADEGQMVYCCEAVLSGARLDVSKKIGDKYLSHLLVAMLQPEPSDRPTAQEVLDVLKTKRILDIKEDSTVQVEGESKDSRLSMTTEVVPESRTEKKTCTGYCSPWAEHKITFNEEKMRVNGYIGTEQTLRKGLKCYTFYKKDGSSRIFTIENLKLMGIADTSSSTSSYVATDKKESTPKIIDEGEGLWEEDSTYKYDMSAIKAGGYKGVSKIKRDGKKLYALIKNNDEQKVVAFPTLKLLKYVLKK